MEKIKAKIFDIQRFALHDGDGIRTTVFFKGCNLACVWCQNPEGIDAVRRCLLVSEKCIGCNRCSTQDALDLIAVCNGKRSIKWDSRADYAPYVDACPVRAIRYDSRDYALDELLEIILKDKVFYNHQGGVTLSGGEPLLQARFTQELLIKLKEHQIHTAIETALEVPTETLERILPYLDQVFCDLKLDDSTRHLKATGVDNRRIKQNLRFLLSGNDASKVTVRTPLIPTLTADTQNIMGIAHFLASINPQTHYELLNFNPLAIRKYEMLGKKYFLSENKPMYTDDAMEAFRQAARDCGLVNVL